MERIPMTPEGYEQLKQKLDKLKNVEIPRLEKALGDAREMGDISENAEFDSARDEIWRTEQMIGELEDRLARAQIITADEVPTDTIAIGALVTAMDLDTKRKEEILLVGEGETRKEFDCVSVVSPLGQAFIGKKSGEVAELQAPRGLIRYRVVSFKYL